MPLQRIFISACACLAGLALVAPGCTTTTPARPVPTIELTPAVGQPPPPPTPYNGVHLVTFHTRWLGPVRARLTFEPTSEGFKANTRTGVAWSLVGGFEGVLGPLLAPFLFPEGMILTWESALPERAGDGVGEGTLGFGSVRSFRTPTILYHPDQPFVVTALGGRPLGFITVDPVALPQTALVGGGGELVNYAGLASRVSDELPVRFFDPVIGAGSGTKAYLAELREGARTAQDDAEWLFVTALTARAHFKTGWPLIYPRADVPGFERVAGDWSASVKPWSMTRDFDAGLVTLELDALTDIPGFDDALAAVESWDHRGLILDLRNCGGLDAATAFHAASRLLESPTELGVLFGPSARARVLAAPGEADGARIEVGSGRTTGELESELDRVGTARVVVMPGTFRYARPIIVLAGRRTSGVGEWLVKLLKDSGRATVLGDPTAGRPLMSREFDLGQGWVLRCGAADLISGGKRLSGEGVRPDSRVGRDEAPRVAKEQLLKLLGAAPARTPEAH